ncbi:MAG: hypothetical protein AVDCRST_MAG19-4986, partial [uncultured Thermomicrobiales bacterium]
DEVLARGAGQADQVHEVAGADAENAVGGGLDRGGRGVGAHGAANVVQDVLPV